MLVKIIALGLTPAVWKNVFHHLRGSLPKHPFAAGIFSSREELEFLTGEIRGRRWSSGEVDFFLCDLTSGRDGKNRISLLKEIVSGESRPPAELVLTLSTLEHGIKQLIQGAAPVEVLVDGKIRFSASDPAFIIRDFPKNFPRVRVDEFLTSLRLKRGGGKEGEIPPASLRTGTLLGFSEIEAILSDGEALSPEDWLKKVLRQVKKDQPGKIRLGPGRVPGLIKESKGLYLCPGIPAGRITGAVVRGVAFSHLLDLGQMTAGSTQMTSFLASVRKAGNRHKRRWRATMAGLHAAESKADLPVVCGGGLQLMRESLAALLSERGFLRCSTLESPSEGTFREPALLLQIGSWDPSKMEAQVEEPLVVALEDSLEKALQPLDGLLDWRSLPYKPVSASGPPLDSGTFQAQREELNTRQRKAEEGRKLAENRRVMLDQEIGLLGEARERLAELLEARETLQVWSGSIPRSVRQVLVFSHDPEEAGAVLQALPGIAKKRWFDLSPYSDPEAIRNLSLDPVREYFELGFVTITASSREKLGVLREGISETLAESGRALAECDAAGRFYREEIQKTALAKEALARQWVHDALDGWLTENLPEIMERLEPLRHRHERSWFSRALVNRVAIVASNEENRDSLLTACRNIYPGFNPDHSRAVVTGYEPLDALPGAEKKRLRDESGPEPPEGREARLEEALRAYNRELLRDYLREIVERLGDMRADLVIIEQSREAAFAAVEHLRHTLPALQEIPAIMILPDYWAPEENQAMPWPHTRVIPLRRMGPLTGEECSRRLQELYSG